MNSEGPTHVHHTHTILALNQNHTVPLSLLQKPICALLPQVLKLLNSNSESPNLIWTNGTRAELLEFLEHQQERVIKRVRERERGGTPKLCIWGASQPTQTRKLLVVVATFSTLV